MAWTAPEVMGDTTVGMGEVGDEGWSTNLAMMTFGAKPRDREERILGALAWAEMACFGSRSSLDGRMEVG